MTDPERDLAAKVREGITAPPSHLATGMAIMRHDDAHAALDSLLALTVKYREALEAIIEWPPPGPEQHLMFTGRHSEAAVAIARAALAHTDEGSPE